MEPLQFVVQRIKGFTKSCDERVKGVLQKRADEARRRNPIEILKRCQREAFSDLMKLRDRQDKVERILSLYKSGQGRPFQEGSTHIKGVVDVVGALLFPANDSKQTSDILNQTGINSKFIFETVIRQKDAIIAEFLASKNSLAYHGNFPVSPLALAKVLYLANISEWLSFVSIPMGAQCKDFRLGSNILQCQGLTDMSSFQPPLFSQYHGCAAGLTVKGSNFAASFAEMVSGLGTRGDSDNSGSYLGSYGQVTYQPFEGIKLTLSGLFQMARQSSEQIRIGPLAMLVGGYRQHASSDASIRRSTSITRRTEDAVSADSIALMLETELDEGTRFGGWVELQKSSPSRCKWAFSLSDMPEDELGWGVNVAGTLEGHLCQAQLEGFLKFSLGRRFNLQPGLIYAVDGRSQIPALMLRSSCSL